MASLLRGHSPSDASSFRSFLPPPPLRSRTRPRILLSSSRCRPDPLRNPSPATPLVRNATDLPPGAGLRSTGRWPMECGVAAAAGPHFSGRRPELFGRKPFVSSCTGAAGDGKAASCQGFSSSSSWMSSLLKFIELFSILFPVWIAVACLAALARPQAFTWITGRWQMSAIIITMLGMGMTLTVDDFGAAFSMPKELLAGVILQYTVMPAAGAIISHLFKLPSYYAAGLVLVACCPGGTASNVVTYLARGNVALSVIMTSASTFLAVIMTPFLTAKFAGQYVAVDAAALLISTLQVVLVPVMAGVAMAHFFPEAVKKISPFAPMVAIIAVAGSCASAIAQSSEAILTSGGQILAAVVCLHFIGFLLGFVLSKLLGFANPTALTISIEVGMQNSVLGVVLANKHFINPLTAVPCAISSVCHSILGSSLAAFWRAFSIADGDIMTQKGIPAD